MSKKNRKFIIITSVILVLLLIIFRISTKKPDDTFMGSTSEPSMNRSHDSDGNIQDILASETDVPYETILEDYLEWAQYPPDSRPLKSNYTDQIEFHWIPLLPQKMLFMDEEDKQEKYHHECRLQPLTKYVTENEKMVVELACQQSYKKDQENSSPPPPIAEIKDFSLEGNFDTKTWKIPQTTISKATLDDKSGKYTHRFEYTPRRSDWGNMRFYVSFSLPAEKKGKKISHDIFVDFFSSPVAPAVFTGSIREIIENGSLVIYAELDVKITGDYTIEANLYNEDGPIAFARTVDDESVFEKKGLHEAKLLFFGKIFHDQDAEGPYKLVGLRGQQHNLAIPNSKYKRMTSEERQNALSTAVSAEPDKRIIPTLKTTHTTASYSLDDFSDEEYTSERKEHKTNFLRSKIDSE